jgi:hypothetical protein
VYLAERLAKHLRRMSGVEVLVRHLELEKTEVEKMEQSKMPELEIGRP